MTKTFLIRCVSPRVPTLESYARKFQQYLPLLLVGAFAASAIAQGAQGARGVTQKKAAPQLTYNDGDLFLGFRSTDGIGDYLVNIGQPDQFVKATPGSAFQVAMGSTSADLAAVFGADWYTRIDPNTGRTAVLWAVVGGRQVAASGDPENTLYSTNPLSKPWPCRSDTAQSYTTSLIAALGNTLSGNQPTANNPKGLVQRAEGSNSYAFFQPKGGNSGGVSFQTWNPSNEASPLENLFFDRITPGPGTSTVLGAFALNSNGQLSFSAGSNQGDAMPSVSTSK